MAGRRLRSERKWEGGSDGALGLLALVIQIHPRLDRISSKRWGCFGASRTLHIPGLVRYEHEFMLRLTADSSLTCLLILTCVEIPLHGVVVLQSILRFNKAHGSIVERTARRCLALSPFDLVPLSPSSRSLGASITVRQHIVCFGLFICCSQQRDAESIYDSASQFFVATFQPFSSLCSAAGPTEWLARYAYDGLLSYHTASL